MPLRFHQSYVQKLHLNCFISILRYMSIQYSMFVLGVELLSSGWGHSHCSLEIRMARITHGRPSQEWNYEHSVMEAGRVLEAVLNVLPTPNDTCNQQLLDLGERALLQWCGCPEVGLALIRNSQPRSCK